MSLSKTFSKTKIGSGGLNAALGGQIYQRDTFLSILCKSNLNFSKFEIATELKEFGVFDDAVAHIENYGKMCLQCKWKNTPSDFELDEFFMDGNFYLPKYLMSFLKIKDQFPDFNMFLIITNKTLSVDSSETSITLSDSKNNEFVLYANQLNDKIFENVKRFMIGSSHRIEFDGAFVNFKANLIVSEFVRCSKNCQKYDYVCLKAYKKFLTENIFDEFSGQFLTCFNANHPNEVVKAIFKILESKFELKKFKLKHINQIYKGFLHNDDPELKKLESKMDKDIKTFMREFYLIVDINLENLDEEIAKNLKDEFNLENVDYIKSYIKSEISNWIQNLKDGESFDKHGLETLYANIKNNNSIMKVIERTSSIFKKGLVPKYTYTGQLDALLNSTKSKVLNIKCAVGETHLIACKLFQFFENRTRDSYMFLDENLTEDQFLEGVEVFSLPNSFKYCVVICRETSQSFENSKSDILTILEGSKQKFLVVISDKEIQFDHSLNVQIFEEESVKLYSLSLNSATEIINNSIKFQEKTIKLHQILSASSYKNVSIQKLEKLKLFGNSVVDRDVYNGDIYIERTLKKNSISQVKEKNSRPHVDPQNAGLLMEETILNSTNLAWKVSIVVNDAGFGKSFLLNHFAETIKNKNPDHLVINIALIEHAKYLIDKEDFRNEDSVIDFLAKEVLKISVDELNLQIFRDLILNSGKVFILLDGFDEIALEYRSIVLKLLKFLMEFKVKKMIISSRAGTRETLENLFNQFSFSLVPFSEKDQKLFLTKYWSLNSKVSKEKFIDFADKLIDTLKESLDIKEFIEIPFTLRLIAEIYSEDALNFLRSNKFKEIETISNLHKLFESYFNKKLKVFFGEKIMQDRSNPEASRVIQEKIEEIKETCHHLAISIVFKNKFKESFSGLNFELDQTKLEELRKCGMILWDDQFIHKYLAEYFYFDFLIENFWKSEIMTIIFDAILKEERFKVIKNFLISFCKEKCGEIEIVDESEAVFIGLIKQSLSDKAEISLATWELFNFYFCNTSNGMEIVRKLAEIFGFDFMKKMISFKNNGQNFLNVMIENNVDVSTIYELLSWVSRNNGIIVIDIFKYDKEKVFEYLELARTWFKEPENKKFTFSQFDEFLENGALNELFHQINEHELNFQSISPEIREKFKISSFNRHLQLETFHARLLSALSDENTFKLRDFFEEKLNFEILETKKVQIDLLDGNHNAFYNALKEKHLETFKYLIRSISIDKVEIVGKALCKYLQTYKDEFNILQITKVLKGLNFTKKLLESQFKLENDEQKNLLFSSLKFDRNCLNLLDFCHINFKNYPETVEKILSVRDQNDQNFIQIIESNENSKLLRKIYERFENYEDDYKKVTIKILKDSLKNDSILEAFDSENLDMEEENTCNICDIFGIFFSWVQTIIFLVILIVVLLTIILNVDCTVGEVHIEDYTKILFLFFWSLFVVF